MYRSVRYSSQTSLVPINVAFSSFLILALYPPPCMYIPKSIFEGVCAEDKELELAHPFRRTRNRICPGILVLFLQSH